MQAWLIVMREIVRTQHGRLAGVGQNGVDVGQWSPRLTDVLSREQAVIGRRAQGATIREAR